MAPQRNEPCETKCDCAPCTDSPQGTRGSPVRDARPLPEWSSGRSSFVCDSAVTPGGIRRLPSEPKVSGRLREDGAGNQSASRQRRTNFLIDNRSRDRPSCAGLCAFSASARAAPVSAARSARPRPALRPPGASRPSSNSAGLSQPAGSGRQQHRHHAVGASDVTHCAAVTVDQHAVPLLIRERAPTIRSGTGNFVGPSTYLRSRAWLRRPRPRPNRRSLAPSENRRSRRRSRCRYTCRPRSTSSTSRCARPRSRSSTSRPPAARPAPMRSPRSARSRSAAARSSVSSRPWSTRGNRSARSSAS